MLYYSTDYDLIAIEYDDNGIRYVDVWEHGPCDW
jgi:hypothetical protein